MDILGTAASLPVGTDGAADDGAAEYVYRFAPLVGIYGGTLEVFRNMIAQYVLGLGKPNYSPPVAKKASCRLHRRARKVSRDGGERFRRIPRHAQARRARRRRAGLPPQVEPDHGDRRPRRRTLLWRPSRRGGVARGDVRPRRRVLLRGGHPILPARLRPRCSKPTSRACGGCSTSRRTPICSGSCSAAPSARSPSPRGEPVTEDMPFNWHGKGGAYIESRRQAEDMVLQYARERGLPAVAMCVSNPYGPRDWQPQPGHDGADGRPREDAGVHQGRVHRGRRHRRRGRGVPARRRARARR